LSAIAPCEVQIAPGKLPPPSYYKWQRSAGSSRSQQAVLQI
jgi:hypothetical protein